jgi:hypothetical protein
VTISVGYLRMLNELYFYLEGVFFIFVEKLILQVPWKNLYTHPTKATIDGLFLLVVPITGLFV